MYFLFYDGWLKALQACSFRIIKAALFSLANSSSRIWCTSQLKGRWFQASIFRNGSCVIIFPLPSWFRGTRVQPTPGNLNSVSEQLSLGCFSKNSTAEERNDFAIEDGFLKKWFSLEKGWLNQLGVFCRMCGFHWLFHWKPGQCYRQGWPASCQPACHVVEKLALKTCLPQPQPELEGLQGPQGAVANPTGSGSCRAWWYVPKQRGFAALGSLILEGLPHALPEGEGYRQLCMSKSLGVHGEAKERKTGCLTQEFPGEQNSKFPLCSSSSVNVHMLPVAYKQYKCLLTQHIIWHN